MLSALRRHWATTVTFSASNDMRRRLLYVALILTFAHKNLLQTKDGAGGECPRRRVLLG
jgi:hypothetical protein